MSNLKLCNGKLEVVAMDTSNKIIYITVHFTPESYAEAVKTEGLILKQVEAARQYMYNEGFILSTFDWNIAIGGMMHKKSNNL